jgi:hypothetical protein
MPRAAARPQPRGPKSLDDLVHLTLSLLENWDSKPLSTLAALREKYAGDFVGFCGHLSVPAAEAGEKPGEMAGRPVPFVLTQLQRDFDAARTGRDQVLKARKLGMSTVEIGRDIWYWLMHPGANVRVIVQTESEHGMQKDFARTIDLMLKSLVDKGLDIPLQAKAGGKGRWALSSTVGGGVLEVLEAGASEHTADKKGRGGTTHRLHCTEIAFWEVAAATMDSVLNSVTAPAPGTEVTIESTPNGVSTSDDDPRGGAYFHRMWKRATSAEGDEFTPHFFAWFELPNRRLPLDEGETVTPDQQPIDERRVREEQCWALLHEHLSKEETMLSLIERGTKSITTIAMEFLKWYRAQVRAKGQMRVDKEMPTDPITCFIASGTGYFAKEVTEHLIGEATAKEKAKPPKVIQVRRAGASYGLRIFEDYDKQESYLVAGDTSGGEGGDPAALQVWTRGARPRHVATLHGQVKPKELGRLAVALAIRYGNAWIAIEKNNTGISTIDEMARPKMIADVVGDRACIEARLCDVEASQDLREIARVAPAFAKRLIEWARADWVGWPNIWADADGKKGWVTTGPSREAALSGLEQDHRVGNWRTPDVKVLEEFRTFVVDAWGKARAKNGSNDDLVLTAAIAWAVLSRAMPAPVYRSTGAMPPA